MRDQVTLPSVNSTKHPAKLRRWPLWVSFVFLALLGWQILFRPLPKPVIYFITDHAGGWLINQNGDEFAGGGAAAKRLASLVIEQSLFSHFHEAHPLAAGIDDVTKVRQRLELLRSMLINQIEIPHGQILSSTLLTGVGKCSDMNNAAAKLLAYDFDLVEMLAVDGDNPENGHSFARLWSPQYKDWLYFDIWTDEIQIFRASKAGVVYVSRTPAQLSENQRKLASTTKPMHDMAGRGHVRTHIQTSIAGYILYRLANLLDHGTTWELDDQPLTQPMTTIAIEPDPRHLLNIYSRHSNLYLHARLDHLFGQAQAGRKAYIAVSKQSDAARSTFGRAANIFAAQLGPSGKFAKD